MKAKQKIALFTSARSEYGPLKPLISKLIDSDEFELQILAGGGHFSHEQGMTYKEIIQDGFEIHTQLPFLTNDPNPAGVIRSNGLLNILIADYFERENPDFLLVLGDRSELIPVVSAALILSIPIAHISGGEVTEGASDNQIRHAVSKMSHVHFPATETYKENLVKMGEEEWRICVSGEPSLDSVLSIELPNKASLCEQYNMPVDKKLLLATFHSETIYNTIHPDFLELLIEKLKAESEYHMLFTAANTDIGGHEINAYLEQKAKSDDRLTFVKSLGKTNYYASLNCAEVVIGNSSSGIIEAQSFNVPVINVGSRQDGRLRNPNVMDVQVDCNEICNAIKQAQSSEFKSQFLQKPNIYGDGNASDKIVKFLSQIDTSKLILKKSTY